MTATTRKKTAGKATTKASQRSAPAKPEPPAKRRVGRPHKIVADERTLQTVAGLAKIQCTQAEAAAVLGIDRETFANFLAREPEARAAWENGLETGKASLRRTQFKMAETSAAMAIWLGKQYLGQKDRSELSGDANAPLIPTINLTIGNNERTPYSGRSAGPAPSPQAG